MSTIIAAKISDVRRKNLMVSGVTGLMGAVGALVICLAAGMLLDWWLILAGGVRAAFLAVDLAIVVWLLLCGLGWPLLYGPDEDEIALLVEDDQPAFRTRLIASVQLARPGAIPAGSSVALVRATIEQAESLAGPMDFARVIKTDRMIRISALSLIALILGIGSLAWSGEWGMDLLKRAFLSNIPVPRNTRVLPITDNLLIARGDDVEILALADGVIPESGNLQIKMKQSGNNQSFRLSRVHLTPQKLQEIKNILARSQRSAESIQRAQRRLDSLRENTPIFGATLENVQESFTYRVELNDGQSADKYTCEVMPRPAITRIEARQVYPAYTGKDVEPRSLGDLSLLQGSKLRLSIWTNKPLRQPNNSDQMPNFVHLVGSDKDYPLNVQGDGRELAGEVELPAGTTGFAMTLTDTLGLKSKDPTVYRIDLIADKTPVIRIVQPTRREVLLVREARLKVIFEATDDYAIGKAALKYRVDAGDEQRIGLELKGKTPRYLPGEFDWKLAEVKPSAEKPMLEGSTIEYWIECEDTNNINPAGPGKGSSDHYMIRVVSEAEKRAEMAARIAEIGSNLRVTTDDQEGLANKVQTIVLERENGSTTQPSPK